MGASNLCSPASSATHAAAVRGSPFGRALRPRHQAGSDTMRRRACKEGHRGLSNAAREGSECFAAAFREVWKAAGVLGTSAALLLGSPDLAGSVTESQLIYLEAWRAVDRAYYDKTFNGNSWFRVRENALKKVAMPTRASAYDAIRDSLKLLDDPFTRFLDPDQYSALARGAKGSVTGVGLEVGFDASQGASSSLVVVAPSAGGPAERAGIKPKDMIIAIDGAETKDLTLYQAAEKLQGDEGSNVELLVRPANSGMDRLVTLTRQQIRINPVSYAMCQPASAGLGSGAAGSKLGYIRLATFNSNTVEATKSALLDLKGSGAERYVLDIRNNGGGLFPAGVEVAKMLINTGDIVLIADSDGIRDVYSADFTAIEDKKPLSVLVNKGTASAAEVLTGALKDNKRATVVGEQTFGKGIIQTIVPLSDGSAVAVTVAAYQTPNQVSINKIGIKPDLELTEEVPMNPEAFCQFAERDKAPQLYK